MSRQHHIFYDCKSLNHTMFEARKKLIVMHQQNKSNIYLKISFWKWWDLKLDLTFYRWFLQANDISFVNAPV